MDWRIKVFIGWDVHKESISVAVCGATREPARLAGTIWPRLGIPPVMVVCEAGPTGYGFYRELLASSAAEMLFPSPRSRTRLESTAGISQ
jgi:hypothetical protein